MSEIQAVLGLSQLSRIDEIVSERRKIARFYMDCLAESDFATVPLSAGDENCSFQSFVILLHEDINRNLVIHKMREKNIETMLGTYAMHMHPAFQDYGERPGGLRSSCRAERSSLTLPLYKGMEEGEVCEIVNALTACVKSSV